MIFRWLSNRRAAKQRIEAATLLKEGIEFHAMLSDYLTRGLLELSGQFFRMSVRKWVVAIENEREALLNRSSPNTMLAQNCDMVDTVLRSTHRLDESAAKALIRNLADDLAQTARVLEEELRRQCPWAA